MTDERTIYHIDCNAFYATVECMERPELALVPMAVAGDPQSRCGIILAKNDRAKAYGIQTAETVYQALRKCPDLVLVPPRHGRYMEVSRQVKKLFAEYTDQVESFGADEAWLDVTGSLRYFKSTPVQLANTIRERVKRDIGVTVSVGVSFNKIFSKLGSDMKKPDATTLITPGNFRRKVWPLPVEELLFVGEHAAERLKSHQLGTIGDVARCDCAYLEQLMGKGGDMLWAYANGLDDSPVRRIGEREKPKSIGNGMTFRRDLLGWEELRAGVVALSDEVAERLRQEGLQCATLQVTIRRPDMKTITRQAVMDHPTHLQKEIIDMAMRLLHMHWRDNAPVRALTITAQQLMPDCAVREQLCLFGKDQRTTRDKFEKAEKAMQLLRHKYGRECMAMGCAASEELGIHQPGFGNGQCRTIGGEALSTST